MIYIVVAFMAEAKPLIKKYKLSLVAQKPFHIYENETIQLIISGLGTAQALIATTHLLTLKPPKAQDILLNLGIAAAKKEHPIGDAFIAHSLHDDTHSKVLYPDMRLPHPFRELTLTTVTHPQNSDRGYEAIDMEAYAIFQAGVHFFSTAQMIFFKVISDHFSSEIPDKQAVYDWIEVKLDPLFDLLDQAQRKLPQKVELSTLLKHNRDQLIEVLKLTKAQVDQLNDLLKGYLLRHKAEPLLPKHLPMKHKKEQKDAFKKLIDLLAS